LDKSDEICQGKPKGLDIFMKCIKYTHIYFCYNKNTKSKIKDPHYNQHFVMRF